MYKSPIDIISSEMQMQIEGEVFKAIQNVGVCVDKEELLKALTYDREQYSKGYADGYSKAIDDLTSIFRAEFKQMMNLEIDDCINWADWLDATAKEMRR